MYRVVCAAAAAFHLVLHSAGGLHIFDHASGPAVYTVAGCSSQQPGYNRIRVLLKRVITRDVNEASLARGQGRGRGPVL